MSNEITSTEQQPQSTESTASESARARTDAAVEQVVDSALGLGKLWARHGLTIGKLALETSAVSLGTTARMLASIAEAIAPASEKAETDEAA